MRPNVQIKQNMHTNVQNMLNNVKIPQNIPNNMQIYKQQLQLQETTGKHVVCVENAV